MSLFSGNISKGEALRNQFKNINRNTESQLIQLKSKTFGGFEVNVISKDKAQKDKTKKSNYEVAKQLAKKCFPDKAGQNAAIQYIIRLEKKGAIIDRKSLYKMVRTGEACSPSITKQNKKHNQDLYKKVFKQPTFREEYAQQVKRGKLTDWEKEQLSQIGTRCFFKVNQDDDGSMLVNQHTLEREFKLELDSVLPRLAEREALAAMPLSKEISNHISNDGSKASHSIPATLFTAVGKMMSNHKERINKKETSNKIDSALFQDALKLLNRIQNNALLAELSKMDVNTIVKNLPQHLTQDEANYPKVLATLKSAAESVIRDSNNEQFISEISAKMHFDSK